MLGPLSYLDIALIVIAGLSGLLAMYRGFTREILSILSWALAAGAGLYVGVKKLDWAQQLTDKFHIPNKIITQVGLGGLVFLVVLVIVHLITARISDGILDSRVGMIDRVLGFTFGVLRGFLLIVILFAFFEFLYPSDTKLGVDSRQAAAPKTYPYGIRNSRSLGLIASTGDSLKAFLGRIVPSTLTPPSGTEEPPAKEQSGSLQGSRTIAMA